MHACTANTVPVQHIHCLRSRDRMPMQRTPCLCCSKTVPKQQTSYLCSIQKHNVCATRSHQCVRSKRDARAANKAPVQQRPASLQHLRVCGGGGARKGVRRIANVQNQPNFKREIALLCVEVPHASERTSGSEALSSSDAERLSRLGAWTTCDLERTKQAYRSSVIVFRRS